MRVKLFKPTSSKKSRCWRLVTVLPMIRTGPVAYKLDSSMQSSLRLTKAFLVSSSFSVPAAAVEALLASHLAGGEKDSIFRPSMAGGRMRELLKKYGKVALGVHLTVSTASIAGLYVAIRNNVDVDSLFHHIGLSSPSPEEAGTGDGGERGQGRGGEEGRPPTNRTAELAASSGGALALAMICNKALFPVRVPITVALTPAVARFLARRNIFKNHL